MTRFITTTLSVSLLLFGTSVVCAEEYPNKPIRIVTGEAGGGNDLASRLVAQGLTESIGQPVIVDNRPSILTGEIVSQASPDGYTLLYASGSFWTGALMQKMPYDPIRDFSPVTLATSSPLVLVVNSSSPIKSIKDLIGLAKTKPGALNYASTGGGGNPHLAAELFKAMTGTNILRIAYKGGGQGVNAVLSGEVQMMFMTAGGVVPLIKSGKLRALGIANARPSTLVPELPTIASTGLPGYESVQMSGVFVPAKTPSAIINRLNKEIVRVLNRPDVKEKFFNAGLEVIGSTPQEFAVAVKTDMAVMGKVIKNAGIKAD